MAIEGSYQWWRDNYLTHAEFQRVRGVLSGYGIDLPPVKLVHGFTMISETRYYDLLNDLGYFG